MPAQKDISRFHGRRILLPVVVPVGHKDGLIPEEQHAVFRKDREIQHHLIHLRITVPADTDIFVPAGIQHRDDLLRVVLCRKIVPRAVIEKIPEKDDPVRTFLLNAGKELSAVMRRAVDIRSNQYFLHIFSPFTLSCQFLIC